MKNDNGFTIVELMVTLAVAAILLGLATPSFRDMLANNRLTGTATQLLGSLNLARGEAIKRNGLVTVSSTSGTSDWTAGWTVSVGAEILRSNDAVRGGQTVSGTVSSLQFNGRGAVVGGSTPNLDVCDGRSGETGRRIEVERTGRVQSVELAC